MRISLGSHSQGAGAHPHPPPSRQCPWPQTGEISISKSGRHHSWLRLYATDRYNPRELSIGRPADAPSPLAIGPFRGRKRIKSALDLLRRCYPIRRCTEKNARQESLYGQTRSCLQPCTKDPDTVDRHDRMVQALLRWLTGGNEREGEEEGRGEDRDLPEDPIARAENLMRRLSREQRYEEAEEVRQACVDLREIRRSYACLKEALDLNFVAF